MAKKKRKARKRVPIPPSPIDRLGWSGKSRRVRLRLDANLSDERDPEPADQLAGTYPPDYDQDELEYVRRP